MTDNKKTEIAGQEFSKKEIETAQRDGIKDTIKDRMAGAVAADTGTKADVDSEEEARRQNLRVRADLLSTFIAPLLDLSVEELEDRLTDAKHERFIGFDDAKGLLHLERSGKNRTEYVKMFMKVLKIDSPYEVSDAGPSYTNDVTTVRSF